MTVTFGENQHVLYTTESEMVPNVGSQVMIPYKDFGNIVMTVTQVIYNYVEPKGVFVTLTH